MHLSNWSSSEDCHWKFFNPAGWGIHILNKNNKKQSEGSKERKKDKHFELETSNAQEKEACDTLYSVSGYRKKPCKILAVIRNADSSIPL